jgi:hypothetical protein
MRSCAEGGLKGRPLFSPDIRKGGSVGASLTSSCSVTYRGGACPASGASGLILQPPFYVVTPDASGATNAVGRDVPFSNQPVGRGLLTFSQSPSSASVNHSSGALPRRLSGASPRGCSALSALSSSCSIWKMPALTLLTASSRLLSRFLSISKTSKLSVLSYLKTV